MVLARSSQKLVDERERAKSLTFGVGVNGAGTGVAASHPHLERQRLGPAARTLTGRWWPVQIGGVPSSPLKGYRVHTSESCAVS